MMRSCTIAAFLALGSVSGAASAAPQQIEPTSNEHRSRPDVLRIDSSDTVIKTWQ